MVVKRTASTAKKVGSAVRKAVGKRTGRDGDSGRATTTKKASTAKSTSTTKASAKATPAKKTPAKATPAKKTPAKATPAKKTPAKATPAKNASAKATPAKKATSTAAKAPAKKASTKSAAKAAPARKASTTAKTSTTKKAATKKAATKTAPPKAASTKQAAKAAAPKKASSRHAATKRSSASKVSPASLPVRDGESPWTAAEVREVRAELERDVEQLSEELQHAESDLVDLMRDSGDGAGDDEADAGAKTYEREQEISLANNAREMLEQTEHALERLETGTYGTCESCGNPIGKMRLQAAPRATLCMPCKTKQERR